MTLELTVKTEDAGTRLDAFIAAHAPELTRSQAARLIEEGAVTVGSARPAKSARVAPGETVAVRVPAPQETVLTAQDIPLDVVYEDEDVIVVNKPTGMVVHPAPGHPDGTLVNALLHHCGDSLSGVGGEKAPRHRPPHRPRHQRLDHRGEERHRAPRPLGAARGSHARADI